MSYHLCREDLVAAGFKAYGPSSLDYESTKEKFQKRITDNVGTRYFVNVEYFDYDELGYDHKGFTASCQLSSGGTSVPTFNVDIISCNAMRPEDILAFYEKVWNATKPDYYEKWSYE